MIVATLVVFVVAIVLLAMFGAGAWLVLLGLRGRIVGDDPHCTRCGFNLRGPGAVPLRCSECGADLYDDHAIRVGRRERRRPLIVAGATLMLIGAAPFLLSTCG